MAKRKQTTGLPKPKPAASSSTQGDAKREHKSRAEREAEIQRYVILGTGVAIGLVVVVLLAAVIIELVINPNRAVATVNGETITVSEFEERVRLERALLNTRINNYAAPLNAQGLDINQYAGQEPLRTWLAQVQIPDQLGNTVINTMVEDTLVRQRAEELGITVSEEDIENKVNEFLGFDLEPDGAEATEEPTAEPSVTPTPFVSPTPSPVPSPTPTVEATAEVTEEATEEAGSTPTFTPVPATSTPTFEEQVEERDTTREEVYSSLTSSARISRERLTQYFETLALRDAIRDETTELGDELLHVNARHILVNTQEEAEEVLAALEAGESFADLAASVSIDTGSGANGGELGWSPAANFVTPFADAVTEAEIGEIVGPVETEFGWHIVQLHGREMREVTDQQLVNAKATEFDRWLENQREQMAENIEISPIWVDNIPAEPVFFLNSGV